MAILAPSQIAKNRKLLYQPSEDDYSQGIVDTLPPIEEIIDTASRDDDTAKKFLDLSVTAKAAADKMVKNQDNSIPFKAPDMAARAKDQEQTPVSNGSMMRKIAGSDDFITDYGLPLLGVLEAIASKGQDPGTTALSAQKQLREQKTYDEQQKEFKSERAQKAIDRRNMQMYLDEVKAIPANAPDYQKRIMKTAIKYEKDPTKVIEYMRNAKSITQLTSEQMDNIIKKYGANSPIVNLAVTDPEKALNYAAQTESSILKGAPVLEQKGKELEQKGEEFHEKLNMTQKELDEKIRHDKKFEDWRNAHDAGYLGVKVSQKQEQFDEMQWPKLVKAVNPLSASSRSAIGVAANSNMRADRALDILYDKHTTANEIKALVDADILAIMKGGVPDAEQLKNGLLNTFGADLQDKMQYWSNNPQEFDNPAVRNRLIEITKGLNHIDNSIIDKNLGMGAASYIPLIQRHPDWWAKVASATQAIGSNTPGSVQPAVGSAAPQPQMDQAAQIKSKLIAKAKAGDAKAQAYLQSKGIAWQ